MKLWLLERTNFEEYNGYIARVEVWWGGNTTAVRAIVRAHDEESARALAVKAMKTGLDEEFRHSKYYTCTEIPIDGEEAVIAIEVEEAE